MIYVISGVRRLIPEQSPDSITRRANNSLDFSCVFESRSDTSVTWTRDGGDLPDVLMVTNTSSTTSGVTRTTSMVTWRSDDYSSEREEAGGLYSCTAVSVGKQASGKINLSIKCWQILIRLSNT